MIQYSFLSFALYDRITQTRLTNNN